MNDYSRGYIGVQLPMDAKPDQVRFAVAGILAAFNLGNEGSTAAADSAPVPPHPADNTPPAPAAQVSPAQVANAELDKDNLPWDQRIHAGTKTKTQKGMWTRRKGVDDATFNSVVAELRQQYPAADSTTTPAAPVTAPTPPTAPSAPAVSIPAAAPAAATPYQQFADWLARNTGEGKSLPASWVEEQFKANGTSLAALATNQEASAQFLEAFRGVLKQMGVAEQ